MVEFESQIMRRGIKPFCPRIPSLPISLVASPSDENADDDYDDDDDDYDD